MLFSKHTQYSEQIAAHSRNVHETKLKRDLLLAIGHTPDLQELDEKLQKLESILKESSLPLRKEGK